MKKYYCYAPDGKNVKNIDGDSIKYDGEIIFIYKGISVVAILGRGWAVFEVQS